MQSLLVLQKLNKDALSTINYVLYSTDGDEEKMSPAEVYMINSMLEKIRRAHDNLLQNSDIEVDEAIRQAQVAAILKEVEEYSGNAGQTHTEPETEA